MSERSKILKKRLLMCKMLLENPSTTDQDIRNEIWEIMRESYEEFVKLMKDDKMNQIKSFMENKT